MYFPDELFAIVKEYAGIYSVGTKYNVSKLGKDKLIEFYENHFRLRLKNITGKKADVIKKYIMKKLLFKMTRDKWVALHQLCNPPKSLNQNIRLVAKIGEEISWWEGSERALGLIVGLYKNSYKVRRYTTKITLVETHNCFRKEYGRYSDSIVDPITFTNHTYIKDKFHKGFYNIDSWSYISSVDGHRECFKFWVHEFNPNIKYLNAYDVVDPSF